MPKRHPLKLELGRVVCPICGKTLGSITGTHLGQHNITTTEFRRRYPDIKMIPASNRAVAIAKGLATKAANPATIEIDREKGRRLVAYMAGLPEEVKRQISQRSRQAYLARYTPEQRAEHSRKAGKRTAELHPEMYVRGREKSHALSRTPEGRAKTAERARALWTNPEHRANVSEKNRQHAIAGRIKQMFRQRPTENERAMIALVKRFDLPLDYVGDGGFRIKIQAGQRNWRNPDFIVTGQRKVVLLDTQVHKNQMRLETLEYENAGWAVLRIAVPELHDPKWFCRKVRKFIGPVPKKTHPMLPGI